MVLDGLDLRSVAEPTNSMLIWFFIKLVAILTALIYICYAKGEKPRWRWGLPRKGEMNNEKTN